MGALQQRVMQALYGEDIWSSFSPSPGIDLQGWGGEHCSFLKIPDVPGEKIIVDVGVWKGQSTACIANILKNHKLDGVVIAVDTFLGSPEHWNEHRGLFNRRHGLPDLYHTFMSNMANAGFAEYVVPLPQTTSTAASILKRLGIRPSVVHVDAAHEYREAMNDMQDYWEILADGGLLIGDDYDDSWPGVVQAAGELAALTDRSIEVIAPKFLLGK